MFCVKCGSPLMAKEIESKLRPFCPNCGRIHYEQLKVGAGALIEREGRLLLLQRTQEPFASKWNLPSGYVDNDESPAEAVVREVAEETGLCVEVVRLRDVYYFDDDPRGNGIHIVYQCRQVSGELSESIEGRNPTYFSRDDIPDKLAGGGHDKAILAWKRADTSLTIQPG